MNNLMTKMSKNKAVIGPFVSIVTKETVEILGLSGFDFCIIDGEHGPGTYLTLQDACIVGDMKEIDMSILYRVPENTNAAIGHALDVGASGLLVPHVDDAESAMRAVRSARFYPAGDRGMHGIVRAARYGNTPLQEYMKKSNKEIMLMLQIEGLEGLLNLDEILDVDGFDGIFIGPFDLSQSLGVPGQVDSPIVEDKIKEIVNKVRSKNKNIYLGTFLTDVKQVKKWVDMGIQFISFQTDALIFANASKALVGSLKQEINKK